MIFSNGKLEDFVPTGYSPDKIYYEFVDGWFYCKSYPSKKTIYMSGDTLIGSDGKVIFEKSKAINWLESLYMIIKYHSNDSSFTDEQEEFLLSLTDEFKAFEFKELVPYQGRYLEFLTKVFDVQT